MLLSCLAMLLGVAVIIFVVFTIGTKELHEANTLTNPSAKLCILTCLFSVCQRPSSDLKGERDLLKLHLISNLHWRDKEERKYQIEDEKAQNLSGKKKLEGL